MKINLKNVNEIKKYSVLNLTVNIEISEVRYIVTYTHLYRNLMFRRTNRLKIQKTDAF